MISIKDLEFAYTQQPVLNGISVDLAPGRIYGLLGKNGEGKSTLLQLLCGLLFPTKGYIAIDGEEAAKRTPQMLEDIFIVAEEMQLPNISLMDYVKVNSVFYPRFSQAQMEEYLAIFGYHKEVNFGALSMGERKKVFLSFALACNTRYLLMDEPTNGLDIPSKTFFRKVLLQAMNDERTFIISTHQVRDIDALLDHLLIIDNGRLLVNHSVEYICDRLSFYEVGINAPLEDVIYAIPSVHGNYVVRPFTGEHTKLNLELFFTAALGAPEALRQALLRPARTAYDQ